MLNRIVAPFFLFAILFIVGCDDETAITPNEQGLEESISVSALPQSITNYLELNLPTTEIVSAVVYKNDGEALLYRTTQNEGTEVTFDRSGQEAEEVEVADLPQSILDYINDNYSGEEITKAAKRTNLDESVTYFVIISNVGVLKFDDSGEFLGSYTKGDRKNWHGKKHPKGEHDAIDVADLPATISEQIAADYPEEVITDAEKVTMEDGTIYYLAKVSNVTGVLVFAEDGTFIKRSGRRGNGDHCTHGNASTVEIADLPTAIVDAITAAYPDATIEKAKKLERNDDEVVFFVKISTLDKPLKFDAEGNAL